MAIRFYLVPTIGDGLSPLTAFRAKYTDTGAFAGWDLRGRWAAMNYGLEPICLLRIDITTQEHTELAAQPDVMSVPLVLDSTVTAGALATVRTALESRNIPGQWVTAGMTYRQVLTTTRKIITFMQRLHGVFKVRLFAGGRSLDTTFGDLTIPQRQWLTTVADAHGLNYSGVTLSTTLRAALKLVADQLPAKTLAGELL